MAVTSWPWQHCTPLSHRHPGIVRKPTRSGLARWWLVIYVWTERTVYQWPVPSYQLRAHMKFNQIPSASLHNSDCWSCTAAAAREQYQLRGPPCPSVSPSLHGLMMVEDRAATSIRHCPAWILCPACDRDVLQVIHISWNVLDIHLSTSNIQFLSSFKHLVKF